MVAPSTARISPRMSMFQPTRRQRIHANRPCTMLRSVLQGVPDAAHGADQGPRKASIDLVAQVVDVDLDHVRGGLAVVAPDVFGDLVLAQHAAAVAHEI